MLPSVLTSQLQTGVEDFLRTTFPTTTPHFHGMLDRFLEWDGSVFKGPYVNVDLPFRHSGHGPDYFPEVPLGFPPYAHQAQAFDRLNGEERASTLVATGTGSGKTEAFLWPILDDVRTRKDREGIKAILIYPMNALANDQAGRIAGAVHEIDALDDIRVGLYVGDQDDNPTTQMGAEHVITSRPILRQNPPDVLLTNYKMLDYLLTRPSDAKLWRYNDPETLRYLVVDELHTFDGAHGTDLACLIRRLKDRLGASGEGLCCVGTSATLGGADDFGALRDYAEDVFGEPFEDGAVIGEQRVGIDSFLADETHTQCPGPDQLDALRPDAYVSPSDYVAAQVKLWLGPDTVPDVETDAGRVQLGERLRGHGALRALLDELEVGPQPANAVAEALAERGVLAETGSAAYRRAALDSLLALLSWARSTTEAEGEEMLVPFVQMRSQLWLRELRRMVGSVEANPTLTYWDDLPEETERDPHLPVVHCLECGAMGWVGIHRQNESQFHADLKGIYRRYFNDEPTFSFAFPMEPEAEMEAQGKRHRLCGHDLQLSEPGAETCTACGQGDKLVEVFRPENTKVIGAGKQIGSRNCPFCNTRNGLQIIGSRAASLTSVLISQLYASTHNDDKKLLTFSDSVQDAAHRAGFFEARTYRFNLRGAIQKVVEGGASSTLADVQDRVAAHYRERMSEEAFVSTFIAPDMEWFREYEALQQQGSLPEGTTLVEDLSRRLGWEVWSKYGFRSRTGRTLEKTGSSVATPDPDQMQDAVQALTPHVQNLGNLRDATAAEVRRFLGGIVQHLKNEGAVFHPELTTYVEHGGNHYVLNKRPHLPSYGKASRLPAFISERSTNRFDPILTPPAQGNSWLEAWALKCFRHRDDMLEGVLDALYKHTLDELVSSGLLDRRSTTKGHAVWGVRPDALQITDAVAQVRCQQCGHNASVAQSEIGPWTGTPCLRYQCTGTYAPEETTRNYYRRLYSRGDLQRIVAREHTGLLGRQQREDLETAFQRDGKDNSGHPWDPNLLSCTPTLELGVDVGQLSSVFLCSVPPSPSNFVQRIGRGGRRSGNAVDVTVANGRPHDLYFFEDPTEMIDGDIEPPGVFLGAVEVLVRQYVAYCFDRWIAEGVSEEAVPSNLSTVLRNLDDNNVFPHTWLAFVETHEEALFDGFVRLFEEVMDEERVEALRRTLDAEGGLERRVATELEEIKQRRANLHRRSRRLYRKIREREDGPVKGEKEKELDEMRREKKALQDIYQRIGEKNTYNFFTDAGLLPNYAFPESGVTLRSILYRNPQDADQEVWDEEFLRPARQALQELAPGATFYANGRRVQVDQLDLSGEEVLERWRFCDRCAYMERVAEGASQSACPNCGSSTWSDQGQERTLVQHDEVRATTADRESRIDDDSEGREREFFEMAFLASFDTQEVETAFRIDDEDLAFGFEFIEEGTFREINFGRPRERPLLEVGGQEITGEAFLTCPACGRVAVGDDPIEHTRSCSVHQQSGSAPDPESLFLYREFQSEALRILLPETSFAGTPEKVESFKAAFELGLEEYFDGSVDHLKTAMQEGPGDREIARRRYLLVYDSVPGGTGYLADLLRDKEILLDVLEEALAVLTSCACIEDEARDGCYRCLYAYRNHYDMPHTSRSTAQELLEDLLARRDQLVEIGTVTDISVDGVMESELEARFIQRLRDLDVEPSRLKQTTVNGRPGYELEIGEHTYAIEPQVTVGPDDDVARCCSIDFVIRAQNAAIRPIAVFLDGLQYHRNRIGKDLAQRRALRASGQYTVWSLTWRDVKEESTVHAKNLLQPGTKPFPRLLAEMGEERSQKVTKFVDRQSFSWLVELLETQETSLFQRVALAQGLLFARRQSDPKAWRAAAEEHLPDALALHLVEQADQEDALLGLREGSADRDPVTLWAAMPASALQELSSDVDKARRSLTLALHLDDRMGEQRGNFEAHWNGVLRLYNLFQFLPDVYPVTPDEDAFSGYDDLIGLNTTPSLQDHLPAEEEPPAVDEEAWAQALDNAAYSPDAATALLESLKEATTPAPEVPFELLHDDQIVGTAEIGWPDANVAVFRADQESDREAFANRGWTVYALSDVADEPEQLMDALLAPS